jgi:phosphoserine phosphatase
MLKPDDEVLRKLDIDHMTDEELEAKAAELEAMAKGCNEHADELERFIASRRTDVSQAYAPGDEPAGADRP